jgi:hypothetical protein
MPDGTAPWPHVIKTTDSKTDSKGDLQLPEQHSTKPVAVITGPPPTHRPNRLTSSQRKVAAPQSPHRRQVVSHIGCCDGDGVRSVLRAETEAIA